MTKQEHLEILKDTKDFYTDDELAAMDPATRRRIKNRQRMRQWRAENREKHRAYMSQWRAENREKMRAWQSKWAKDNLERVRETKRRYREENRDKIRAYWNEYRLKNQEKIREYQRQWKARQRAIQKHWPAFGELSHKALMENDIYAAAYRAVPKGLPQFVRDDVVSEIVLACLEGRITPDQITQEAKTFLRAHYRQFNQFKTLSLDAPVPGTDGLTYLDMLTDESNALDKHDEQEANSTSDRQRHS